MSREPRLSTDARLLALRVEPYVCVVGGGGRRSQKKSLSRERLVAPSSAGSAPVLSWHIREANGTGVEGVHAWYPAVFRVSLQNCVQAEGPKRRSELDMRPTWSRTPVLVLARAAASPARLLVLCLCALAASVPLLRCLSPLLLSLTAPRVEAPAAASMEWLVHTAAAPRADARRQTRPCR